MDLEFVTYLWLLIAPFYVSYYAHKNNVGFSTFILVSNYILYLILLPSILDESIKASTGLIIMMLISLCYWLVIFKISYDYKKKLLEVKNKILNGESINVNKFHEFAIDSIIYGTYVLHNLDKDIYYVGLSKNVIPRVKSHFNGGGNRDVFLDYRYGNDFNIYITLFESDKFDSLGEQEKYYIKVFDSFNNGYNRTRGG